MKQLFFSVVFTIGVISFSQAQSTGQQGSKNAPQSSASTKSSKAAKSKTAQSDSVRNNRVIYKSKKSGQAATVTGQQATGTNGTHANNPKNAGKNNDE